MKEILIQYAVEIAAAIVLSILGIFFTWIGKLLADKFKLSNIKDGVKIVETAAEQTVLELKQTVVDDLKAAAEDGKLTKDEIAMLGAKLIDLTLKKLSSSVVTLLTKAEIDIVALIKSSGEAFIAEIKDAK